MSFGHKNGDSTAFLGSLFQCLITPSVKKFYLMSNPKLSWCNSKPSPAVLLLVSWEKRLTWNHRILRLEKASKIIQSNRGAHLKPKLNMLHDLTPPTAFHPCTSETETETAWSSCTSSWPVQLHRTTQEYCSSIPPSTNLILKLPPRHSPNCGGAQTG